MAALSDLERLRLAKEALVGRLVPELLHQLRNPLNAILTSAELFDERGDDANLRETLVPVLLRSAQRIRDLLSAMDYRHGPNGKGALELRKSLDGVLGVLSCRQHSLTVHPDAAGQPVFLAGDGEALWTLILFVLEASFRSAKDNVWIRTTDTAEHLDLMIAHDGDAHITSENSSGPGEELMNELARQTGARICYGEGEPGRLHTLITFRKHNLLKPAVQK